MDDFFMFETWTTTAATVHRGDCGHCKHGQGTQGRGTSTPNGRWHGPFRRRTTAEVISRAVADDYGNADVWTVGVCPVCLS